MSRHNIRLSPQMADDNHNHDTEDDRLYGTFGGFNMIKAKNLSYDAIFNALKNQEFYCSQGPEILDLYVEDGVAHITCSNVKDIIMLTGIRHTQRVFAKGKEYITTASFKVEDKFNYIRFDVIDENGCHANTRAYFTDEWK